MATRPPRLVTIRLVFAAAPAGVLLALLTSLVAALATNIAVAPGNARTIQEDLFIGSHLVVTSRSQTTFGTVWERAVIPLHSGSRMIVSIPDSPASARVFDRVPQNIWLERDGNRRTASLWLAGWPMRSIYGVQRTGPTPQTVHRFAMVEPTLLGSQWSIPFMPYVPGLVANSSVFGGLALMIMMLARWLRTRRRAAIGLCIACGYNVGKGTQTCPECGLASEEMRQE